MKYKFSRNEIQQSFVEIVKLCEIPVQIYSTFLSNLLAQKEDRKEKSTFTRIERPTPSPLELPKMHNNFSSIEQYNWAKQITDEVNNLKKEKNET